LSPLRLDFVKPGCQASHRLGNQPPVEPSNVATCARNRAGSKKILA
jgi:hypothetical protein